jgi:ABC-type transport system involved in multi-copper enzyme maturation permease subunit
MTVGLAALRSGTQRLGGSLSGVAAIGSKELRGRMRGRRAFAFLTFYLTVLSGFVWMLETLQAQSVSNSGFGSSAAFASTQIGTTVFAGLLFLETLLVTFLAPAFTTGAISQEREKQTLDLLVATPISSLSIVLGKLFSALAWVFILVIASIPLTGIVFVFGGVAPEDLVRGYLVLIVDAIGLGCIGLFFSALLRRTLAATVAAYFVVLSVTLGATFVWGFLTATNTQVEQVQPDGSFSVTRKAPPEALLWFNPFVADVDVLCPTGTGSNGFCSIITTITNSEATGPLSQIPGRAVPIQVNQGRKIVQPDGTVIFQAVPGPAFDNSQAFAPDILEPPRDLYWPRSAAAWLVLSAILVLASVNLVSPTRRWRPHQPIALRLPRRTKSTDA